jgi:gamma-glutamyltranspeptidase
VHFEGDVLYVEPGVELGAIAENHDGEDALEQVEIVRFAERNLFFGGVQAVRRHGGSLTGAGDPRRGGVAVSA